MDVNHSTIDIRKPKISVVLPALNEADYIAAALRSVRRQTSPFEAIVVDGGSIDDTPAKAIPLADRVLTAPRGRARQMNRGAEAAMGDVLLFLHADTRLPPEAFEAIRRALADPAAEAGTFRLRFDRPNPLLRFYSLCTRLPWHLLCFGDRGLFVRRAAFETVGGYPDWPIFEDLELARRLHRRGGFRFLQQEVVTSARRLERHGPLRQQLRNAGLWLHYLCGTDPDKVAHRYAYNR